MKPQSRVNFIINVLFLVTVFLVIYFCLNFLLPWFLPFLIGLVIAFCLKPVITFLSEHIPLPKKACALLSIFIVFALSGALLWFVGSRLLAEAGELFSQFPEIYSSNLGPVVEKLSAMIVDTIAKLFPSTADATLQFLSGVAESFESIVRSLSASALAFITEFIKDVPSMLFTAIFTVIATFFISMDYANIVSFLARQVPQRYRKLLFDGKDFMVYTVLRMMKAYLILMIITAAELSLGFLIIGVDFAIPIAILIAFLDLLPVIGTGGIMIPWIIVELIRQNFSLAIGLSVIYLIVSILRNVIEPKIVGQQIGLHPVASLAAMYVGFRALGVFGMLLAPILAILIKWLCDKGHLKLYTP